MIEVDQYKEYTEDEIHLGRAVSVLIQALYNRDGTPKDIADKAGRKALVDVIQSLPKEIPAKFRQEDLNLLRATIKECQETRAVVKMWFWYIVGAMFLASLLVSVALFVLFR